MRKLTDDGIMYDLPEYAGDIKLWTEEASKRINMHNELLVKIARVIEIYGIEIAALQKKVEE